MGGTNMPNINRRIVGRAAVGVAGLAVLAAAATLGARVVLADDAPAPAGAAGPSGTAEAGLGNAPALEKAAKAKEKVPQAPPPPPVTEKAPAAKIPVVAKDRIPSSIPARAFLQKSDAPGRGSTPERRDGIEFPDFCGLSYQQTS